MSIRELFQSDVTRDIPPVVYFQEQTPAKVAAEVSEYIITGGWPESHPNHRRVPSGIHEQYVGLLEAIADELDKPGGPELPNAWISGFYGSGKSSFAKLLGLALDGVALPGGESLAEAWLRRDTSPKSADLREAWRRLRAKIDPIAVVFDVGGVARDGEHVHAVALRQLQRRLGYCTTDPHVADFELGLERDRAWQRFEAIALETLGKPWAAVKDRPFAEEQFSEVMARMFPERYSDPMTWFMSRAGTHARSESPEEAVTAIHDMLGFRRPGATLFFVVDEVSQYVLSDRDRVDRLRAFATALGTGLRGKGWLVALGQQSLDDEADISFLYGMKDRFPHRLRVHLAPTNIRDVVHKRLLQKTDTGATRLRELFDRHRPDLKLYAYGCESVTPDEFIDVYPLLPGQIELILRITSALRARSTRAQGDDQAIRGLLQLLGELFRSQRLADDPIGSLVTLDKVYEVQHTALDSDVQASMARLLAQCQEDTSGLLVRAAKVVALLELIQEEVPTDARLVAQCLYDRLDRGNNQKAVTEALEELRRQNLVGYSEKQGYKIQSSAGEEWERERRDIASTREALNELAQEGLKVLLATVNRPRMQGRSFPWSGSYSDGRRADYVRLEDPRDEAVFHVDFRLLARDERIESVWVKRSAEHGFETRLLWLAGDTDPVEQQARELHRSRSMVRKYKARRESLNPARRLLLQQEENRAEDLEKTVRVAVADAWMSGRFYFRGRGIASHDHGGSFAVALESVANRLLPDVYPHFVATQVLPAELEQLLVPELSGPSPKFLGAELGILEVDSGRYVPTCSGTVVRRVQAHIEHETSVSGTNLLTTFGGPPFGYTPSVVKACVAGLLRASRVRIQLDDGSNVTAVRDPGVRDLFGSDRSFKRATIAAAGDDDIGAQSRNRICRFFEQRFDRRLERDDHSIADAVAQLFPPLAQRVRDVQTRLAKLPGARKDPAALTKLAEALEACVRVCRQTKPTVQLVKKHLDALNDGLELLQRYDAELVPDAIQAVRGAHDALVHHVTQLREVGIEPSNVEESTGRLEVELAADRPWRDVQALCHDTDEVQRCYIAERERLIRQQEQQVEAARGRVRARSGFSTLTADASHRVLGALARTVTDTTPEAVAPSLLALRDLFVTALQRAESEANELLDQLLSTGPTPLIRRLDLHLQNRELASEADVEALVAEIRQRLLEQVRAGSRVRLV